LLQILWDHNGHTGSRKGPINLTDNYLQSCSRKVYRVIDQYLEIRNRPSNCATLKLGGVGLRQCRCQLQTSSKCFASTFALCSPDRHCPKEKGTVPGTSIICFENCSGFVKGVTDMVVTSPTGLVHGRNRNTDVRLFILCNC